MNMAFNNAHSRTATSNFLSSSLGSLPGCPRACLPECVRACLPTYLLVHPPACLLAGLPACMPSCTQGPFDTMLVGGDEEEVTGLKFSNDGKMLMVSTMAGRIYVLDAFEGDRVSARSLRGWATVGLAKGMCMLRIWGPSAALAEEQGRCLEVSQGVKTFNSKAGMHYSLSLQFYSTQF